MAQLLKLSEMLGILLNEKENKWFTYWLIFNINHYHFHLIDLGLLQ